MNDLEDEAMRCSYCSETIPADSVFCEHCGRAVIEPERTNSAEAKRLQAQPVAQQPPKDPISTTGPGVPQRASPERILSGILVGVVVGAVIGALPGALILLAAFVWDMTNTGSATGVGLLGLGGIAYLVAGGAVGALVGGVLGALVGFRKRTGQDVAAERREDVGVAAASDAPLDPWYKIWLRAFFKPTQDTIADLVRGHSRDRKTPYLWIFSSSTIGYALWFIPNSLDQDLLNQADLGGQWLLSGPLLMGIVWMLSVRILVAITQFVASKLLGGEGTSSELFYIYAAMVSPARLISGIIALLSLIVPLIGYLAWALSIYELALLAIAARAINRFGWSKAIIAALPALALQICGLLQ